MVVEDIGGLVAKESHFSGRELAPFGEELEIEEKVARLFQPDILLPYQYLETFRSKYIQDPVKALMLAVLEDAVLAFQNNVKAKDNKGSTLFRETEDWILERDGDSVFSFENICEELEMDGKYLRQGLMKWKERQLRMHPHYHSKPKKSEQDIGSRLTRMQTEAIGRVMIAACNPAVTDYGITERLKSEMDATASNVQYHLKGVYSRLNAHDMPSAVHNAFHYGFLNLKELPRRNLKSLEKGVEKLTHDEKRLVRAYGKLALRDGNTGEYHVKNFLKVSWSQLRARTDSVKGIFGVKNTAYFGIAAYYINSKR